MGKKIEKLRAVTNLLFDNDPLVNLIIGLSGEIADKTDSKERIKETEEAFEPATNPFLQILENMHEGSPEFQERTQQALEWYADKIGGDIQGEMNPLETYETRRRGVLRYPGQLITFKYNPKNKRKLPFYDVFPLVLTLDVYAEGFLGLNFHYLRPRDRAILMGALYKYQTTKEFKPIIKVRYEKFLNNQALRFFRPCIKRYLYKQMSPNMAILSPHLWDQALFLPTDKFTSSTHKEPHTRQMVWEKSRKIIRKYK